MHGKLTIFVAPVLLSLALTAGCATNEKIRSLEQRVTLLEQKLASKELGPPPVAAATPEGDLPAATKAKIDSTDFSVEPPPPPPGDLTVLRAKLRDKYVAGNYSEAREHARTILIQVPNDKQALQMSGVCSCYLGDVASARQAYQKMNVRDRNYMATICRRNKVSLEASAPAMPAPGKWQGTRAGGPAPATTTLPPPGAALATRDTPVEAPRALTKAGIKKGVQTVISAVTACRDRFPVPGLYLIRMVIGPDGKVRSAQSVGGVTAGNMTGQCIAGAMADAKFPTFSGPPLTVTHPFILR